MQKTDILAMSLKELNRLEILQRARDNRITQKKAADLIGLSVRQTRRLMHGLRDYGPKGIQSKKRGKKGNRRLSREIRRRAIDLVREHYEDFGPKFARMTIHKGDLM